jgi:acyl carrier protein
MNALPKDQILNKVVSILNDMTADWDVEYQGGIRAETRLIGDLSFESIEVVQLMVLLEQQFQLSNLASERLLMKDGRYVKDLSVQQVVDFLALENAS